MALHLCRVKYYKILMTDSLGVLLCMFVGFSVVVIDEDGTQQLHITDVKAEGLASAKGAPCIFPRHLPLLRLCTETRKLFATS